MFSRWEKMKMRLGGGRPPLFLPMAGGTTPTARWGCDPGTTRSRLVRLGSAPYHDIRAAKGESAFAKATARLAPVRSSKEMCHSTKRTHFNFAKFSLYRFYIQKLMPFAGVFANGFVLGKRTQFGGSIGLFSMKKGFVRRQNRATAESRR
jgi:hypothetical protein